MCEFTIDVPIVYTTCIYSSQISFHINRFYLPIHITRTASNFDQRIDYRKEKPSHRGICGVKIIYSHSK